MLVFANYPRKETSSTWPGRSGYTRLVVTEAQIRAGRRRKPCPFNVWLVLNWICRRHHHFADTCWQKTNLLTLADNCWQLPTRKIFQVQNLRVCWHVLTLADTCWHLLTFADICWRLLNLAGSNDATIFLKCSNHTGRSFAGAQILRTSNLSPKTCLGRTFQEHLSLTLSSKQSEIE